MVLSWVLASALGSVTVLGPTKPRRLVETQDVQAMESSERFPIKTPGLVLGRANPKQIKLGVMLARALCVIGADNISLRWLSFNAKAIQSVGGLCYVVNITRESDLAKLRAVTNVHMVATSGQVFVQAGLRGYPALIMHNGLVK